jgi:hypothetical protein
VIFSVYGATAKHHGVDHLCSVSRIPRLDESELQIRQAYGPYESVGCLSSFRVPDSSLIPLNASLNPRIPFPNPWPSSGSFLGPNISRAIPRIRIK